MRLSGLKSRRYSTCVPGDTNRCRGFVSIDIPGWSPGSLTPFQLLQALSHIASRLEFLHASKWVHRDLKPGNILRLPHLHSWTLMDFGCAGREGMLSYLSYTDLTYSLTGNGM